MLDLGPLARAGLLLGPFFLWDLAVYLLRRGGDRSPRRRATVLRHFTEEDIAAGRAHLRRQNQLLPLARLVHYGFYGLLLMGGLAARLESWLLEVTGGSWVLALPLFLLALLVARLVIALPISAYAEFVIQRRAGLSTVTVRLWLLDRAKTLLLGWLLLCAIACPFVGLLRALPRHWPLPAAAMALSFSAFLIWIKPWVIDPLFSRFTPLDEPHLAGAIRALLQRAGISAERVYVMDASRRSLYLNAYFTGIGGSRRVVLYDTLVEACPIAEVLSVVAHEIGHWRGRHILAGFLLEAVAVVLGLQLVHLGWDDPAARALVGVGAESLLAALVALPLLADLASVIVAPLGAAVSRRFERAADRAALELTADASAFIGLSQRLVRRGKVDLLQPRLLHRWYGTHPLPEERIAAAERAIARPTAA